MTEIGDSWPAPPDDPQGIRVASVIEFSVCLCVLGKFSNFYCSTITSGRGWLWGPAPKSKIVSRKKLENLPRTDKQTENSITEATLIPCGSSGGAGQ